MRVERLLWGASLAIAGCSGEHDFLAQKGGGTGGAADAASAVDVVGDERRSSRPAEAGDVSFETATPDVVDEPLPPEPGRFSVTLTNGLADAEGARFCFVPMVMGQERRDQVLSVPELAFGKSLILSELRGIDRSTMDVRPYVVVEEGAGFPAGQGCGALDMPDGSAAEDGAARRRFVAALPLIPAGTLAEERSYLGVVTGCVRPWPFSEVEAGADGGDAGTDASGDGADAARDAPANGEAGPVDGATMDVFRPPARVAICGPASGDPSAGLVLVRLSQRDVGTRLGLQAVHASAAVSTGRIAVVGAGGASPIFSVNIQPFQITPRDMPVAVEKDQFGPALGAASVQIGSLVGAFSDVASPLANAFKASGIDETVLGEGALLSLVLIGAQPGQDPGPPWNAARIAVVRNAPLAGGD
jgi:hypothetical protein